MEISEERLIRIQLQRIAEALEALAVLALPPPCACGHADGLHIPQCNDFRCKCERYTLPVTALVSIANQQLLQIADLKMVIANAAGLVPEAPRSPIVIPQ